MSVELERKYLGVTREELRPRLVALGAKPLGPAHFESNTVYDRPGGELGRERRLLRLRTREWPGGRDARLTYKEPLPDQLVGGRPVKRREEVELGVSDPAAMDRILRALGFVPAGAYEKVRESWLLDGAHVDMDELVFGHVVEVEAGAEELPGMERRLSLDKAPVSANSYYHLYAAWALERGLEPGSSFTFPDDSRAALRAGLGLGPGGKGR